MQKVSWTEEQIKNFIDKYIQTLRVLKKLEIKREKILFKRGLLGKKPQDREKVVKGISELKRTIKWRKKVLKIIKENRGEIEFNLSIVLAEFENMSKERQNNFRRITGVSTEKMKKEFTKFAAQIEKIYEEIIPDEEERILREEHFLANPTEEGFKRVLLAEKKRSKEFKKISSIVFTESPILEKVTRAYVTALSIKGATTGAYLAAVQGKAVLEGYPLDRYIIEEIGIYTMIVLFFAIGTAIIVKQSKKEILTEI